MSFLSLNKIKVIIFKLWKVSTMLIYMDIDHISQIIFNFD